MPSFNPQRLAMWCGGAWRSIPPTVITSISNDTRTLSTGALYVAIRGERFDGHAFVDEAFRQGAVGALVDHASTLPSVPGRPLLSVADTMGALGVMAQGYRHTVNPVVVGVTGSVGKSTVKEMTASILSTAMPTARSRGNWNNAIGLPLSLLAMEVDTEVGVFEIGMNHPGEIAPLAEMLCPTWGVITAIGPVHIECFESVDAIAREKAALLQALPSEGHAVLCCDDPYFEMFRDRAPCVVHSVSLENEGDYRVTRDAATATLTVCERASGEVVSVTWPWPGRHNALNAGYAVAVARGFGVSWDCVRQGLGQYQPLPMRWEVQDIRGITVVNDAYNANPLSMRAALEAFKAMRIAGDKWLVLGGMRELGAHAEREHAALGASAATGPWGGIVTVGPEGETIAQGCKDAWGASRRIWCCADNAEAADLLREHLCLGDGVLLKASRGVALENIVERLKNN